MRTITCKTNMSVIREISRDNFIEVLKFGNQFANADYSTSLG